jgi:hypothetical protein
MRASTFLAVFLAVTLLAGSAMLVRPALAAEISIDPPSPTVGDSVKVVVKNSFATLCWSVLETSCSSAPADSMYVIVDVNYCGGAPSCVCGLFPQDYQRLCNFGLLPAGSYVAAFFENHINPFDPLSSFVIALPFTVTGPTPVVRRTWGKVKAHYR